MSRSQGQRVGIGGDDHLHICEWHECTFESLHFCLSLRNVFCSTNPNWNHMHDIIMCNHILDSDQGRILLHFLVSSLYSSLKWRQRLLRTCQCYHEEEEVLKWCRITAVIWIYLFLSFLIFFFQYFVSLCLETDSKICWAWIKAMAPSKLALLSLQKK